MTYRDPPYAAILGCAIGLVVFGAGAYFLASSFYLLSIGQGYNGDALGFLGFVMMLFGLVGAGLSAVAARKPRYADAYGVPSSTPGSVQSR